MTIEPRPDHQPEHARPPRSAQIVARVRRDVAGLRPMLTRPPTLPDLLEHARRGEWTTVTTGWRRSLMMVWVCTVAAAAAAVGYGLAWAAQRPLRLATTVLLLLLLGSAADQVPVLRVIVPDLLSIPAWGGG
ncbi:MAG: hypothetical protein ACRCZP_16370 [Phycicoccus sp.]